MTKVGFRYEDHRRRRAADPDGWTLNKEDELARLAKEVAKIEGESAVSRTSWRMKALSPAHRKRHRERA